MDSVATFSVLIPESVMDPITGHDQEMPLLVTNPSVTTTSGSVRDSFKNDLIDASVDLVALLPTIKLKLSEAMSLKKGDIISIGDPEQVELLVGDQTVYKAVVGQSNALRVVKITDTVN